jgi:16S rRNA (adenine(1408)-N(1))-methyltransferase
VVVDLGTGDGRAVLARARSRPDELVVGFDASLPGLTDASRRAARDRLANACFIAHDAVRLPADLAGFADALTITFPWGSLLDAVFTADPAVLELVKPGGTLRLLVSASPRDEARGATALDLHAVAACYGNAGLASLNSRPATFADAEVAGSSWGKRLLRSGAADRLAWLFEFRRC